MNFKTALRTLLFGLVAGASAYAMAGDVAAPQGSSQSKASTMTLSAGKPRPTHAVGKLACDSKTYLISTGTDSGDCVTGIGNGDCKDGANSSSATCKDGCGASTGKGTCTEK